MDVPEPGVFAALLDAAPDAMIVVDARGRILLANVQTERLFGYARDDILGSPVEVLLPDRFRARHERHRFTFSRDPKARPMGAGLSLFGLAKDGREFPVEISLSPTRVDGEAAVIAAVRDVSERVAATEAQRRLAAIVAASVDGIITKSLDGIIVSWNAACERIFGYAASEVVGKDIRMLYPPEIEAQEKDILDRVRSGGVVEVREVERVRKDGRRIWVSVSVSPIRDELGRIVGATSIKRDITDRKRAEAKFQALVEAAPDAIVIVDRHGAIVLVNAQTEKMFGHARADLVGKPVELLIPGAFRERHAAHRERFFHEPKARPMGVGLALSGVRADGSEFPVEISLSPLETGEGVLVTAAIRDVTERKRVEEESRRQLVTKQFVRRILREMTARGGESAHARRELGRSLAGETGAKQVVGFLDAFQAIGIGGLALERQEDGRFEFSGRGLLEVTPGAGRPTCQIALGFLEGVVGVLLGASALGAEVACQSQGRPECRFVVKAKPP